MARHEQLRDDVHVVTTAKKQKCIYTPHNYTQKRTRKKEEEEEEEAAAAI
jgi:hypothetical protein